MAHGFRCLEMAILRLNKLSVCVENILKNPLESHTLK